MTVEPTAPEKSTMNNYAFNESDARQFYKWLRHREGEFTEIRGIEWIDPDLKARGKSTPYFVTNETDFITVCQTLNGTCQVYAGINPRCKKPDREGEGGKAEDIHRVTGFPFDIDGPTPNKRKQASTEIEVKVAESWKDDLVNLIKQQFGIEPYIDFSGNGYRVCLPLDIEVTDQANIDAKLKLFFAEYEQKLKLPDFDNISDLPRIIKVPGVWSLKGEPTEQRPHRQAKLIQLGDLSKIKEISDYILNLKAPENKTINQAEVKEIKDLSQIKLVNLRPCFLDFINNPARNRVCYDKTKESRNTETGLRKALVKEMYYAKFTEEEILSVCKKFDDYNEKKSTQEIGYVITAIKSNDPKKSKTWLCKSIFENGGCLGEACQYHKHKILGQEPEEQQAEKEAKLPNYAYFCEHDEEGHAFFKPALVAMWLSKHRHFKADKNADILYFYDGKSWRDNGEVYLQEILAQILGVENRHGHYNNILHDLKGLVYTEISFSQKIALDNGLLDVEAQEILPFNVNEMPFHKLPVAFDKEAKCPNWEQFISQVVNPDDLDTIQEWSGFLLLPDYRFHKLLWVHGEGRNGKGVWQRTMEAVLGEDNVSSIGLEEFNGSHRFALRQLYGKLFNPCSEPNTTYPLQTPLLKKATGQDTIEAETKGKQGRLKFRNYAKITILANKFPKVEDTTTAFKERRLFIKFPNEFTGKNQIQNIEANWLTIHDERSGILNWMLKGLERLLENGCFTESLTQQETEAEFLRASDTIGAFLKEMVIFGKNYVTTRSETYERYKEYCDALGLDAETNVKFTQRMKDTPKVSVCSVKKPKQERAWRGITLKLINEEGEIAEDKSKLGSFGTEKDTEDTKDTAIVHCNISTDANKKLVSEGVSSVSAVSENSALGETVKFERVNPAVESHGCDKCHNPDNLAAIKQRVSEEDRERLNLKVAAVYLCQACFDVARAKAEADGVKFQEILMEQPSDDGEDQ
jgi:P4 family phage/plasmid primase-like protien